MIFYTVDSNYDFPDSSWRFLQSRAIVRHPGCRDVKAPPPRDLVVSHFDSRTVLTFTYWMVLVVRRDLFTFLRFDKRDDLHLGELVHEDGTRFAEHLTVWSDNQVLIRGEPGSLGEKCEHCGRVAYFPTGNDDYVTRQSVEGVEVGIADGPALLIVNKAVAEEIRQKKRSGTWKRLTLQPIKVVEHAVDGLPDDYRRPLDYLPES